MAQWWGDNMSKWPTTPQTDVKRHQTGRAVRAYWGAGWAVLVGVKALVLTAVLAGSASVAMAQTRAQASAVELLVPSELSVIPAAPAPIQIRIVNPSGVQNGSFVYVKGLPNGASLSNGFRVSPNSWAVPYDGLEELTLLVPRGFAQPLEAQLEVLTPEGTVVARAATMLFPVNAGLVANRRAVGGTDRTPGAVANAAPAPGSDGLPTGAVGSDPAVQANAQAAAPPGQGAPEPITRDTPARAPRRQVTQAPNQAPAAPPPAPAIPGQVAALTPARRPPVAAPSPAQPGEAGPQAPDQAAPSTPRPRAKVAAPPKPPSPEQLRKAERYMSRGDEAIALGDVPTARRFYQRAARIGLAAAAAALAQTYDGASLRRLGVIGVEPDVDRSRYWQARARQLSRAQTAAAR